MARAARKGDSLKDEAPGVGAPRASGSSHMSEETGMGNSNPNTYPQQGAQVVPFRGNQLLLVEHLDEPYVPMRPVVEGMGLAWQPQHRKMKEGRFSSVITEMVTTGADGKRYRMACLPLRKLPGWLMSINAGKVRESIREQVMAYQTECDDVLWQYWNEGHAANHRENPGFGSILNQTIGTDGFHCLAAVLDGKVRHLPAPMRRRAKGHIWSQIHKAFSVVSAEDIPAAQMDSARNFVAAYALEGGWLPASDPTVVDGVSRNHLYVLIRKFEAVREEWGEIEPGLRALGARRTGAMADHIGAGCAIARRLERRHQREMDAEYADQVHNHRQMMVELRKRAS